MRPLNSNEKRLLFLFGLIVFIGINFFGLRAFFQYQADLRQADFEARGNRADATVDLQNVDLWKKREAWWKQHEQPLGEKEGATGRLLDLVTQSARQYQLEIVEQNLGTAEVGPAHLKVTAFLKVKGSMENLCRWLTDLQKPEKLIGISEFSLRANGDEKSMICELGIVQFGREGNS